MKNILLFLSCVIQFTLSAQDQSILFIGNSYTYGNDLPTLFRNIAVANGKSVFIDSYTVGGASFLNHNNDQNTQRKIKSKQWDYVIVQGQSQEVSFPDQQVNSTSLPAAVKLADSIYKNNFCSELMLFMTWGRKNGDPQWGPISTYEGMQERLYNGYMRISDSAQASVAAVGKVWQSVRQEMPSVNLYVADESHPSLAGSYLAAMTIYASIYLEIPQQLVGNESLPLAFTDLVKQIIDRDILQHKRNYHLRDSREHTVLEQYTISQYSDIVIGNAITRKAQWVDWNFGDGTFLQGQNVQHRYSEKDVFNIVITAGSRCNSDAKTEEITISELGIDKVENTNSIYFSLVGKSIFTPNFEGVIYSTSGVKVTSFKNSRDLSDLSSGVYFIETQGLFFKFYLPQ